MKNKGRVLVIGIDGGTFDIINPMVQRGELPILASLMEKGVRGELESTIPPVTAPAWVSFMTGKNPGKHGIFHFIGDIHKSYTGRILSAIDIKAKTIWSLLSDIGKHLILVNIPITYPPTNINGIMITGIGTPSEERSFTYPHALYHELVQKIGDYVVDYWDEKVFNFPNPPPDLLDDLIKNLNYMTTKRTDAVLYLMKEYKWDVCMVVYVITDRLQHLFWRFMDNSHPEHDPKLSKLYKESIFEGYRKVDKAIGRILREIEDDVTVIVMSDHGFGPLHKNFFVNKWLMQKGLLKLKWALPLKFQITKSFVYKILTKLKLGFLKGIFPEKILQLNIPRLRIIRKSWDELINWSKTKVYASDPLGVNINLKGREPEGIVNPGEELEELLSELEKELYKIKDPQTGEKVVDEVFRKEKVYSGPYVVEATDLLFAMKGLTYLPYPGNLNSRSLFGRPVNNWSGTHRFNGIFVMKGPKVKPSSSLKKPRIIDIAPTVLYLLNQPIPNEMDGRVLEETFSSNILKDYPITYIEEDKEKEREDSLITHEEEQVRKHLKDLGYL